jgi:hypothetical protein
MPGTVTGSFTVSPPISHTNSNTTPSTVRLMATVSGCTGEVTGGTTSATLTTVDPTTGLPAPAGCPYLLNPPPAGTTFAKGTFSSTWGNSKTSTGNVKLKSSGAVGQLKLVERVLAGYGFLAGHMTKVRGTVKFTGTNGNCVNGDISMVNFTNITTVTFLQT